MVLHASATLGTPNGWFWVTRDRDLKPGEVRQFYPEVP